MIHCLWERLQLDSRNFAGMEMKCTRFSSSILDVSPYLPAFIKVFKKLIIANLTGSQKENCKNIRTFRRKMKKCKCVEHTLAEESFLKTSHSLYLNLCKCAFNDCKQWLQVVTTWNMQPELMTYRHAFNLVPKNVGRNIHLLQALPFRGNSVLAVSLLLFRCLQP